MSTKKNLTSIEIYTPKKTKLEVIDFCVEMGISMSGYFNLLHKLVKDDKEFIKEKLCKNKTK
ncbi:hypothetical protein [Burkholderia vietnamiensis]|uniref:hypothetical protein n=1 Tax=Burkholderia vietnamiensis TaxID=60552 RepID=UPI001594A212|nr:hypothetical protein [Burkholderia vietnamiensis]